MRGGCISCSAYTVAYWGSAAYAGYWSRPYGYDGHYGWY